MMHAEQLAQGLAAMGLVLPAECREKLLAYLALLYKWNKTFSLTTLRQTLEISRSRLRTPASRV